jgi:hypothetical protein
LIGYAKRCRLRYLIGECRLKRGEITQVNPVIVVEVRATAFYGAIAPVRIRHASAKQLEIQKIDITVAVQVGPFRVNTLTSYTEVGCTGIVIITSKRCKETPCFRIAGIKGARVAVVACDFGVCTAENRIARVMRARISIITDHIRMHTTRVGITCVLGACIAVVTRPCGEDTLAVHASVIRA